MKTFKNFITEGRIVNCASCGEELTAPKFYEGKPYGYSCIKKVCPSKAKDLESYVSIGTLEDRIGKRPVVTVTRDWDKVISSDEARKLKAGQFTINYIYKLKTKDGVARGTSEFATKDDKGVFWIPKSNLKSTITNKNSKFIDSPLKGDELKKELDLA